MNCDTSDIVLLAKICRRRIAHFILSRLPEARDFTLAGNELNEYRLNRAHALPNKSVA